MSDRNRDEPAMLAPSDGVAIAADRVSWQALIHDTGADVAVIDTDGRIRYISPRVHFWRFTPGTDINAAQIVGRQLHELMPRDLAEERVEFVRRAALEHKALVVIAVTRGVRTRTTYRVMPSEQPGPALVLAVCRPLNEGSYDDEADAESHLQARVNDLGVLASLTPRELDVLALIGRGLTTAQIAATLFRSNKTVEAHRLSLGLKLKAANRVQLARIAIRAGLTRRKIEVPRSRPVANSPVEVHQGLSEGARSPELSGSTNLDD